MAQRKRTSKADGADTQATSKSTEPVEAAAASNASEPGADSAGPTRTGFPIVGIGASAGGLAAFEAFFSAMPPDTEAGIAFVLVQHLAPDHKSILTELVKRYTRMQVFEVEDGMHVEPNCAYIIPPNRSMTLTDSVLRLSEPTEPRGLRLPIDQFFRSLAEAHRERAICLVLSGTGSDGALGVRAIKGEGGMAMAQSPETAEHDGMPRNAIATGLVDYVLAPAEMPEQLIAYVRHAFSRDASEAKSARDGDFLRRLCGVLRTHTGHDFSQYKESTLVRRLERRMALHQMGQPEEYLRFARETPQEVQGLFRDLLIGVTSFFRDADAFKLLEEKVIPRLLTNRPPREPVRVWVCGCSTGEEAYSIAIVLYEHIEGLKRPIKAQIFATDIDSNAIEHARVGTFPASISTDVPPARLARFFAHDPDLGVYRVQKVIRDMLVFSEQDIAKDPPFSKLDLVSCRNLLIYLNTDLQKRLIPLFHYALRPGGALFLGPSETVGESAPLFSVVDRKWKLYFRDGEASGARPSLPTFLPSLSEKPAPPRPHAPGSVEDERRGIRRVAEQAFLSHYGHAGVLVNPRGDILHILGRTGKFLEPSTGEATMNIISMAREGLRRELTVALHKAVSQKQPVTYRGLAVRSNGGFTQANIVVRPAASVVGGDADLFLVILEEAAAPAADVEKAPRDITTSARIAQLEQELRAKDEYLQTTLEEMETTNEELKSTNEEMQSVNEELQSTNEELETSKEELQSVNEELSTVNTELQDKVADLSRVNNDMNNLLAGTGVGTLFVDHQMRISRFTPAAINVINLIPSDVGRPVQHVVSNMVGYDHLVEDIRAVLDTLVPVEAEVRVKDGFWYLMRIRPYRTIENVIEGVVITLVDISERKRAEASLLESQARFHAAVSQAHAGVAETDLQGRFTYVNDRLCQMLGYARAELIQKRMQDVTHPDDLPRNLMQQEALVGGGSEFEIEKRYVRKDGNEVWTDTRVNSVRDAAGAPQSLISISFDISQRKRLETALSRNDAELGRDLDGLTRLHAVGTLYGGERSLQSVLEDIVDAAIKISGADMGSIQLLDGANGTSRVAAQQGFDDGWVGLWNGNKANPRQFRSRLIVEDVTQSDALQGNEEREAHRRAGIRAFHSTPLTGRTGTPFGALATYFHSPHRPDERTQRLLDLLALQATDIMERVRAEQQKDGSERPARPDDRSGE